MGARQKNTYERVLQDVSGSSSIASRRSQTHQSRHPDTCYKSYKRPPKSHGWFIPHLCHRGTQYVILKLYIILKNFFSNLATDCGNFSEEDVDHLKKFMTQLILRTQLLSSLLKEAGIAVPVEPALEKLSPLKWSNKMNIDDIVDKYFDIIKESKCQVG